MRRPSKAVSTAAGAYPFALFAMPLGPSADTGASTIALLTTDAPNIQSAHKHVLQMDVWRKGLGSVTGGEWRSVGGTGAGIRFTVPHAQVRAQVAAEQVWHTVEAEVALAQTTPGVDAFGAVGGATRFTGLSDLTLTVDTASLDSDALWRFRNVRLVERHHKCVPCGYVPVRSAHVNLVVSTGTSPVVPVLAPDVGPLYPLVSTAQALDLQAVNASVSTATSVVAEAVDASTLVDPTCGCLDGVELTWEERVSSNASRGDGAPRRGFVSMVELSDLAGNGVWSTDVTYSDPESELSNHGLWRRASAALHTHNHVGADSMDWRRCSAVRMYASRHALSTNVVIRRVQLSRPCQPAAAFLHPRPTAQNTTVEAVRSGLNLTRGDAFKVVTYEVNAWGDVSAPTCSPSFVADDTPPVVSDATVIDIEPVVGHALTDLRYTKHSVLRVGWSGRFVEDESAPDNLLLFVVSNVTADEPGGPPVEGGWTSQDRILAVTSTGYVQTSELKLDDGRRYFAHLGVCNVRAFAFPRTRPRPHLVLCSRAVQRGRVCSSVPSATGVIHDSSPPFSAVRVIATEANISTALWQSTPLPTFFGQQNDTAIVAVWDTFQDPHSPIESLRVGLGTAGFGTDVHEFRLIDQATTSYVFTPPDGGTFLKGAAYYVVWVCENAAGAREFVRTAQLHIDQTPPLVEWVVDVFPTELAGADSHFTEDSAVGDVAVTDASGVRAKFRCDDPEGVEGGVRGNMTYRWRVCNTASCDDTVYTQWMDTGYTPRGVVGPEPLAAAQAAQQLTWLFVQVECTNPAGLSAVGSSNGAFVDMTKPNNASARVVEVGPHATSGDAGVDTDWLSTRSIAAEWTGFTTDPGRAALRTYMLAFGTFPGGANLVPFHSVGLATRAATDPNVTVLTSGTTYFATVRAVTMAGAWSSAYGDGVTMDFTPPAPVVADAVPVGVGASDKRRCASHLRCMEVQPNAVDQARDVDYVASTLSVAFRIVDHGAPTTPLASLEYGASTCGPRLLDLNSWSLQTGAVTDDQFETTTSALTHGVRYCAVVFERSANGLQVRVW